jgi:transcriptional regulator
MYLPKRYRQTDQTETLQLIRSYPFATIITWDESGPYTNHLPILIDETREGAPCLIGHFARANPQVKHIEKGQEVLVVFNGPHSYISPKWYRGKEHVPTWNYAVVHVRGKSRTVSADRLLDILDRSVAMFETGPSPWKFSENTEISEGFKSELMGAIVGFEIEMDQVDAKFKLGQNRTADDFEGALEGLAQQTDDMSQGVLELMRKVKL